MRLKRFPPSLSLQTVQKLISSFIWKSNEVICPFLLLFCSLSRKYKIRDPNCLPSGKKKALGNIWNIIYNLLNINEIHCDDYRDGSSWNIMYFLSNNFWFVVDHFVFYWPFNAFGSTKNNDIHMDYNGRIVQIWDGIQSVQKESPSILRLVQLNCSICRYRLFGIANTSICYIVSVTKL